MMMLNMVFTSLTDGSCFYVFMNVRCQKFCLKKKPFNLMI